MSVTHIVRFVGWDQLPEDAQKDVDKDTLTEEHGYDLELDTGFVHIVDPERPDLYEKDASALIPAAMLLMLAMADDTMTVVEV